MQNSSHDGHEAVLHYSFTAQDSLGVFGMVDPEDDSTHGGLQWSHLLYRHNTENSQANVYLQTTLGAVEGTRQTVGNQKTNLHLGGGLMADWESREWLVSYMVHGVEAGAVETKLQHTARVGMAPYVAEFGGFHTWLMLQLDYNPEDRDPYVITPFVRFFTGPYLLELGMSDGGNGMVNTVIRF